MTRIVVMALQGAFIEHEHMLQQLGAETFEVRKQHDWRASVDGLILPGGESTTMLKLLHELHLYEPVHEAITQGLPVFGTCAGLILLARDMEDEEHAAHTKFARLATMDIEVRRNAYGRQLGSFHTTAPILLSNGRKKKVPMTFIRAPYINRVYDGVDTLATVDGHIVAARQRNQLVTAFHPELDDDTTLHQMFLDMC